MLSVLYTLIIGPLELFFEIIFAVVNRVIDNPGLSIIGVSLAMNFLLMPMYRQADAIQEEERQAEERMNHWVTHIKKTFTGDERYMMLQTYYRQNNYKPTYALRGSVSLLLEIPFFVAAYNFLSTLPVLQGVSFGPIANLGAPDAMFMIGGFTVNVLPILMTAVNLISSAIYTKGLPLRSKMQLYIMAGLFLVLLYDSPAGLVFYWTLNNLFSLCKNIFDKLKNPRAVLSVLVSLLGLTGLAGLLFVHPMPTEERQNIMIGVMVALQLPLLTYIIGKYRKPKAPVELTKKDHAIFRLGAVFTAVLTGLLIPSAVIHSSPEEFINTSIYTNPVSYIWNAGLLALGTFVIWCGIFYMMSSKQGKRRMSCAIWVLAVLALINYMFFGKNYGTLSPQLTFLIAPIFPIYEQIFNALLMVVGGLLLAILWKHKKELVRIVLLSAVIAAVGMSAVNIRGSYRVASHKVEQLEEQGGKWASIPLTTEGQNVIFLMLDRGIAGYVPYMLNEKPELREQFDGFTYYPNTLSFGSHTNFGSPAVFGGYEYTPKELNKRDKELLADKQNEALKVMPVSFLNAGAEVTVCDPTYADYEWIPELSIFDEYPEIHRYNTAGKYNRGTEESAQRADGRLNRNFFCYSLFKTAPVVLQPTFYADGEYNEILEPEDRRTQTTQGIHKATGFNQKFMASYTVLENLIDMTEISHDQKDTFFMMSNETTHEPTLLQLPDYTPAANVDNTDYDAAHKDLYTLDGRELFMRDSNQVRHYHVNMATFLQLGKWFDYLKENDVYDNTRIVLAADHGYGVNQFENVKYGEAWGLDIMYYNPLLMVKDFNATGFTTDDSFMTNADAPVLSMDGCIKDMVNPFTGKPVDSHAKEEGPQYVFLSHMWRTNENNGTQFFPGKWALVHDQVLNLDDWEFLEGSTT